MVLVSCTCGNSQQNRDKTNDAGGKINFFTSPHKCILCCSGFNKKQHIGEFCWTACHLHVILFLCFHEWVILQTNGKIETWWDKVSPRLYLLCYKSSRLKIWIIHPYTHAQTWQWTQRVFSASTPCYHYITCNMNNTLDRKYSQLQEPKVSLWISSQYHQYGWLCFLGMLDPEYGLNSKPSSSLFSIL